MSRIRWMQLGEHYRIAKVSDGFIVQDNWKFHQNKYGGYVHEWQTIATFQKAKDMVSFLAERDVR